jgi:hypothetical protein
MSSFLLGSCSDRPVILFHFLDWWVCHCSLSGKLLCQFSSLSFVYVEAAASGWCPSITHSFFHIVFHNLFRMVRHQGDVFWLVESLRWGIENFWYRIMYTTSGQSKGSKRKITKRLCKDTSVWPFIGWGVSLIFVLWISAECEEKCSLLFVCLLRNARYYNSINPFIQQDFSSTL